MRLVLQFSFSHKNLVFGLHLLRLTYHWFDGGYCHYFVLPSVSLIFLRVSACVWSSMSPGCMIYHSSCRCVSSSVWTPCVSVCGQGERLRLRNTCSKSCICTVCPSDDNGNETEGWTTARRPCCTPDVDICRACHPCAFVYVAEGETVG